MHWTVFIGIVNLFEVENRKKKKKMQESTVYLVGAPKFDPLEVSRKVLKELQGLIVITFYNGLHSLSEERT